MENGAGPDLRAQEYDNMSYYTNLNHYRQLSDGIASKNLKYQFENDQNYHTVTFEYDTDKAQMAGSADQKRFGMILGTTSGTVRDQLKTWLGIS